MHRRRFVALGIGVLAMPARAQASYPDKPITMVVPAPPGGGTDLVARLYSDLLSRELGQQVIVDNKGGGNGNVGTAIVGTVLKDWNPAEMDRFAKSEVADWGKVIRDNNITMD